MRYFLFVLLLGLWVRWADAEQAYIHGIPFAKAVVTAEGANFEELSEKQRLSSILSIGITPSQEYVWSSREGKHLVRMDSGAYMHFIAPTSGWIKVATMKDILLPSMGKDVQDILMGMNYIPKEKREAEFLYYEVLTQGLMVIIYFGIADVVEQPTQ